MYMYVSQLQFLLNLQCDFYSVGHYLFTEGDRIIDPHSTGVVFKTRTPTFTAPPAATSNSSSIHYEQCQVK